MECLYTSTMSLVVCCYQSVSYLGREDDIKYFSILHVLFILYLYRAGNEPSAVVRWLHEHRHIAPILFYISLLMLVALFSSKRVWIRIQHMYEETIDIIRWSDPG